jgi:hypothetical protein
MPHWRSGRPLPRTATYRENSKMTCETVCMSDHHHGFGREVMEELAPLGRDVREKIPGVYAGYGEMHKAAFAEGELSKK